MTKIGMKASVPRAWTLNQAIQPDQKLIPNARTPIVAPPKADIIGTAPATIAAKRKTLGTSSK